MCRGLGDPDQPAKGGRLPRAGAVEMSLDKCVQVYEKGRWGAGGKSVAGRRSSTCKGRWGGGSGTQGAGAELQRVFFASSCPGPVPPFLCPDALRAWVRGVWSQRLAPPPVGALPVCLPILPPCLHQHRVGAARSPATSIWQNCHPLSQVPGHWEGLGSEMANPRIPSPWPEPVVPG